MTEKKKYNNPIVIERADPWIYKHTDGYYYFTGSLPGYQAIELRRAKNIDDLETGERVLVWHAPESGIMSELIWKFIISMNAGIFISLPAMMQLLEMHITTTECLLLKTPVLIQ